ncbi:hypothetical protein Nans01_48830 [Nocardiopsis ansamitocini]|uniref:HTH luxR-type domain-containing protein n=2 Tax=Nocardiopsis ansamitocini TaxID=1670832 RepID=A0A9W6PBK7_9ACTN|nr:hypothetical protein Nans01_48830 [Nocardiopsis ansamitocini]
MPGLSPVYSEFRQQPHCGSILLPLLSSQAVGELAAARLGATTASALVTASGGNPRLLHALIDDQASNTGEHYRHAVLRCLHRGGPRMLDIGRALAVLDTGAEAVDPGELAGPGPGAPIVEAMTAAGLLAGRRFRHDEARAAVLADLPQRARAELHTRAARLLHARGAPAEETARHLVQADTPPPPWGAAVLAEAADQAAADGDAVRALACLEAADRSRADSDASVAAATAGLVRAGWQVDPAATVRYLAPLGIELRAGRLQPYDSVELVRQFLWHGRTAEAAAALAHLRGQASTYDERDAAKLRDLEGWLTFAHPPLGNGPHTPAPSTERATPTPPEADPWLPMAAAIAEPLRRGRPRTTVDRAEAVLREAEDARANTWSVESVLLALPVLLCADTVQVATAGLDRLLAADEGRAPTRRAVLHAARAQAALHEGDLRTAADHARTALTRLPPHGWGTTVGLPLGALILALSRMGDHTAAAALVARPVPEALFCNRYGLHYLYARGQHHLAADRGHAGLADFLACGDLMRGWGIDLPGLVPWRIGAAEAWLCLGNPHQARRLVHEQLTRLDAADCHARGLSLRLLAAVSAPERRPQLLTEAVDIFEDQGDRFELARSVADLGCAHHALGQRKHARMMARRAWHLAKVCGASPHCLGAFPDSDSLSRTVPTAKSSAGIDSLTGSERRVAALAVVGYTNREIAGKLFVTPSTVEQHLTRVYRKLDVQDRRDLPTELHADLARTA